MVEKILDIEERDFEVRYSGYVITTNKQKIWLGIDNQQSCCENWGYFMSEDDTKEFIGAKVLGIEIVDEALKKEKLVDFYDGGAVFVNIETNRGTLQFVAYNSHNGYYGHDVKIESTQLKHYQSI